MPRDGSVNGVSARVITALAGSATTTFLMALAAVAPLAPVAGAAAAPGAPESEPEPGPGAGAPDTGALGAGASAGGAPKGVLPAGLAARARDLLAPYSRGAPLPGGLLVAGVSISPDAIRYRFCREGRCIRVALGRPADDAAVRSRFFGVRLEDPDGVLGAGESRAVLEAVRAALAAADAGPDPWAAPDGRDPLEVRVERWVTSKTPALEVVSSSHWGFEEYPPALPLNPVRVWQAALLAAAALLAVRWRRLRAALAGVGPDAAWLAAWSAVALAIRLVGGDRTPGHINGHGYEHVWALLWHRPEGYEYHGVGSFALLQPLLGMLPGSTGSILVLQATFSVLTVPVAYAASRAWLADRAVARWTASVVAVLPPLAFYAMTEERMVPGVLFLAATLAAAGVAARERDPVLAMAAACLAAVTLQFQPFLALAPLAVLALAVATPAGRAAARHAWTWAAAGLMVLLVAEPIRVHVESLEGPGPAVEYQATPLAILARAVDPFASCRGACNVAFDSEYVPPPVTALAAAGGFALLARRGRRASGLAIVACWLMFAGAGAVQGRLNNARLELPSMLFLAWLAGAGSAFVAERLGRWIRRESVAAAPVAALLVCGLAVWPGPLQAPFAPQEQRRLVEDAVAATPDGCIVLVPESPDGRRPLLPAYASVLAGKDHAWVGVRDGAAVTGPPTDCVVYFRPVECHDLATPWPAACRSVEAALSLEPVLVRPIPARADCDQEYDAPTIEAGLFRVLPAPTAGGRQPSTQVTGPPSAAAVHEKVPLAARTTSASGAGETAKVPPARSTRTSMPACERTASAWTSPRDTPSARSDTSPESVTLIAPSRSSNSACATPSSTSVFTAHPARVSLT